jgi:hypothetical protein
MNKYPDAPGVPALEALIRDEIDLDHKFGFITAEIIRDGKHGPVVTKRVVSQNLIVNTGKRQIWRIASGLSTTVFDQMRIGTSPAAATSGSTNVLSPVTGTLVTVDNRTLEAATRTMQWLVSYPSGTTIVKSATGIQEVVLLNQNTSPGGSAMMRSIFTAVNKTRSDKLRITYRARIT